MPPLPVQDIEVKGEDLIVATHGAGFWILDDISPLRQYSAELADKTAHLFKPADHTRLATAGGMTTVAVRLRTKSTQFVRNAEAGYTFYERGIVNGERKRDFIDAGDARPLGVLFYYLLSDDANEVTLTILDESGNEVRTYSNEEVPHEQFDRMEVREYSVTAGEQNQEPR